MAKFTHLHTHSHYSLLSALPKISDLIKATKEDGQTALALTDNGNLYGAIEFYKECKKAEIKPIIGIDGYMSARTRHDKQTGVDSRRTRLVLLVKDITGYKNLIKIVTISHLEGFYYKPRLDKEILEKYAEGLICIMPHLGGQIASLLRRGDETQASELADFYKRVFGAENFYLEITDHPEIEGAELTAEMLKKFSAKTEIPLVATQDIYYMRPEDKIARDTLVLVNNSSDGSDRVSADSENDFSFKTQKEMEEKFKDIPEAISNTQKIADACNLDLELGKWVFPDFKLPENRTPDEELRRVVFEGFERRKMEKSPEMLARAEYELKVIKDKGYSPYFLIVADLLAYARAHGILSNIRGSVSGSLITFLAGITNINPIEYEIPFERFLNPDRPSAPDIDMDFADDRRDEMVEYARTKYGKDKVAQIGTFGTMAARGSVRDVARALGYEYEIGDKISKMIPMGSQGFPMTIDRALEETQELADAYKKDADTKKIIDLAKKIEGCARHIGVHAAGVVIAPTTLEDFTPLQFDPKGEGKIISQYDMYSIEEAGLLKFDFLGLKNLSIIADTVLRAKKIDDVEIKTDDIPLDDKKTFEMLARGETSDLFQLNGDGMTKFLKDLRPSTIHDINAMVALYRPGPIQFIPEYIERKHNPALVRYLDPALEPILKKTYGILVYQDDLLMMAHKLAGYTWGEVDKFRKAVGKKIPAEMEAQKEKFIQGCVKKSNWPLAKAEQIWKWIEPFAAYGFNKAHSVSYGRVAYITAYLKANFPEIYLSAVLSADSGDVEKIGSTVSECKRMKIPVLPPSVNESYSQFTVVKGDAHPYKIRFGLVTIKNFGQGAATAIIEERKKHGKFNSMTDFLTRVRDKNINKKSLEALIMSGAVDEFGERGNLLFNVEKMLEFIKEQAKKPENQDSLFGGISSGAYTLSLSPSEPATMTQKLAWEKELLGLYISGHPLDKYRDIFEKRETNIAKIKAEPKEGAVVVIGGLIDFVHGIQTKKNEPMAFVTITDFTGSIEVVVFPRTLTEFKNLIVAEKCVVVKGKISMRNDEVSVIVDKVKELG